jgi:xylulokinase
MLELGEGGWGAEDIRAVAVAGTSGTVLPVDVRGEPNHNALMYNDSRSKDVLPDVRRAAALQEARLGYAIKSSFSLPKLVWLCRNVPGLLERTARFVHATDYIVGCLTGEFGVTDHNNALKTGFDLIAYRWPSFIERDLHLPISRLPRVIPPGEPIASLSQEASESTGLSTRTQVVAGMTDGTAAQLASGATRVGSWNSILGTTLVIKGISETLINDPLGRFYSHLHPQKKWMPGGASNTGAEWIEGHYPGENPGRLDRMAEKYLPTNLTAYPLVRRGERFPFVNPGAEGFLDGEPTDKLEGYAAKLEGLAYLERLAYDSLESLGAPISDKVYVTGGGARSDLWLHVRATVLKRQMARPRVGETAMGAAILAASRALFENLDQASLSMVQIAEQIDPDRKWESAYQSGYERFLAACRRRGYL